MITGPPGSAINSRSPQQTFTRFPTKWMSVADMYLLFSGDDYFALRKGTIAPGF